MTEISKKASIEQLEKWADALESGKYSQQTDEYCLKRDGSYCCLGVANEIFNLGATKDGGYIVNTNRTGSLDFVWIPQEDQYNFSRMNDLNELSFTKIAKYIRNEYIPNYKEGN